MLSKPLAELVPEDTEYQYLFTKEVFVNEARKMFKNNIGVNVSVKFIEALRLRLVSNKYPSIQQVLSDITGEFRGEQTLKNLKSTIRRSSYFNKDNGILNDSFHAEYFARAESYLLKMVNKSDDMYAAPYVHELLITEAYTYPDITSRLKGNPDIVFNIPEGTIGTTTLDFNSDKVQFVEISNYTPCIHLSHVFDYTYMCGKCKEYEHFDFPMPSNSRCSQLECFGVLREDRNQRLKRSVYGTHINFNQSLLPVLSLVDLPIGSFTAAVVVRTSDDDKSHYLFVAGIVQKVYSSEAVVLEGKRHAVWELCDMIDNIHLDKLGHKIVGLHYPKAAVIMAAFCNMCGERSHNVLLVGRSATGKSMVSKYYPYTILLSAGFYDARTTSNPGLIGSSEPIKINGQVTKMYNPGVLAHEQLVCIDELYSNPELYTQLKTPLNQPELVKSVAGTQFRIPKVGTVLATANINTSYLSSIRERVLKYAQYWDSDDSQHTAFRNCRGIYSQEVMDEYGWTNNRDKCIMELILKEEKAAGRNYIDGEDISTLERYSFLFYIGEDGKEDRMSCLPSKSIKKKKSFTGEEIRSLTYTPGIEEYLRQCAGIEVDYTDELDPLLDEMFLRLTDHNRIHTNVRQRDTLLKMVELSAAINKRTVVNELDLLFVEDLFMHTCEYFEPEQLTRHSFWEVPIAVSEVDVLLNIVKTPRVIRRLPDTPSLEFIRSKFERYDMYGEGSVHWDRLAKNIVYDLESQFNMSYDEAQSRFDLFVSKNGGRPAPSQPLVEFSVDTATTPMVEIIDAVSKKDRTIPFQTMPTDESLMGITIYLTDQFTNSKKITNEELDTACVVFDWSQDLIKSILDDFVRRNFITNTGDGYRWKL